MIKKKKKKSKAIHNASRGSTFVSGCWQTPVPQCLKGPSWSQEISSTMRLQRMNQVPVISRDPNSAGIPSCRSTANMLQDWRACKLNRQRYKNSIVQIRRHMPSGSPESPALFCVRLQLKIVYNQGISAERTVKNQGLHLSPESLGSQISGGKWERSTTLKLLYY